jgi:CAAD domains of cyanobacterial aminoacyl-tRNA synthetase
VNVIAFRTGGFSDQDLQGAIAIYDDPADLLRHYETSPLVNGNSATPVTDSTVLLPDATLIGSETIAVQDSPEDAWREFRTKTSTFFGNAVDSSGEFLKNNQSVLVSLGWVLLAVVGLKVLFALLNVVDNLPLISPLLKLVGLVYSGWFIWRYLLKASTRQELSQTIERAKTDFLGDRG